ncbi:MAG TPA: Nif3-like dinuclear metal center hexameric protein, partial [Clostridiales bacterium]|nr:Nif3-like dinuclear metal center hexameric protein [Clostridiales bacterium]
MTVGEILNAIDSIAPFAGQEAWDNSGLVVGDFNQKVNTVIVALDLTSEVLDHAKNMAAQVIIT